MRQVNVVLGNREESLNDLYVEAIRGAYPDIDFNFSVATTVPDFIQLACDKKTDLGLFMPPGNLKPDPARPDTMPQAEAVYIVAAIKARHAIPLIVIAAHPVAGEAVLAAGADQFFYIPAQPTEIRDALATILRLGSSVAR